ncbi:GNAT family N-acetyltransferase [Parendozoicomonas callyspongiae]
MNILRAWRKRSWHDIDASEYSKAYASYGGSVITHPHIIKKISDITNMPLRYLAQHQNGKLVAAIPIWGSYIAGSKKALRKAGKNRIIDFGNPEVMLPLEKNWTGAIPFQGDFLSHVHHGRVHSLKPSSSKSICLARSYKPGENGLSKKFKYNKRRELRLLQEHGGKIIPVSELSTGDFCQTYIHLFRARWGFDIKGAENLHLVLESIRDHLVGHIVTINNTPAAIQLLLKAESPEWVSVEYINGGVDPGFNKYSPGSVLSYLHTSQLEDYAISQNKYLRFSFGKSDKEYKDRWCYRSPVYKT